MLRNNYLTNSLNFLPAENAGTFITTILISLPVCRFLRTPERYSNNPKYMLSNIFTKNGSIKYLLKITIFKLLTLRNVKPH